MYKRGLINELSQKLIKSVAKRTVAKYQKTSDAAYAKADKDEKTQDAASSKVSMHAASRADRKTGAKRSQARRVLAKMKGHHTKGDSYPSDPGATTLPSKHGLDRQDMKGKSDHYKTPEHRRQFKTSER